MSLGIGRRSNKFQQFRHGAIAARAAGGTGYRVELQKGKWVVISCRTFARIIAFGRKSEAQKWVKAKLAQQRHAGGDGGGLPPDHSRRQIQR